MDIMRHKDAVDQIVKTGEAIMDSKDQEEKLVLKVLNNTLVTPSACILEAMKLTEHTVVTLKHLS